MSSKTMLTGTFLAEQTHSNPPSYTLVSVSSIDTLGDGPRARPVAASAGGGGGGAGGAASAVRRARAEKFGAKLTKLPALDDFDPLLDKSEDSVFVVPARRGQKSAASAPAGVNSTGASATAANGPVSAQSNLCSLDKRRPGGASPDRPMTSSEKGTDVKDSNGASPRRSPGAASTPATPVGSGAKDSAPGISPAKPSLANRPASSASRVKAGRSGTPRKRPASQRSFKRPASEASTRDQSETFDRLYSAQKPWMFDKTDMELLTYLARRAGDPEIANVSSPCESPSHSMIFGASLQSMGSTSSSIRSPRKHRHHKELFDECLHKDSQRSSPAPEGRESPSTDCGWSGGRRPLYSPQRLAKAQIERERSCRLDEQIRDIKILPVRFFEAGEPLAAGVSCPDKAAFDQAVQYAEAQLLKAYTDYKAWRSKHGYPAPDLSLMELDKDKRSSRVSKVEAD
mmetsp:Transcript_63776/g.120763  ORF Transcript_63776/g.120763 Transcript_63776/m.120763 type:complete len:457 (-) Transcript_63776:120-1490(-)